MSMNGKLFIMFLLMCFFKLSAYSQFDNLKAALLKLKATSDSTNKNAAPEKLYMQFDKPYYAVSDTIWFKAWLINAPTYLLSAKSGFLHIDIATDSNIVVKQYLLPVQGGVCWGNITLSDKEFKPGNYIIRAYTNWMRNFSEDYFYYKRFCVSSPNETTWLVNTRFATSMANGNNTINAKLLFSDMNKAPFAVKPLQLQIMDGNKHLYRQKLQTGVDGALDVNFNIPQKVSGLAIVAESEQKDKRAVIPVTLNRPENADIQFLPEGGNLVAGIPARIGFKAVGEDGKGVDLSGIIADQNQKQAATFNSLHNGMGRFDFFPETGKTYTAVLTLPGGSTKTYPLPVIKASGTVLQVNNKLASDSVQVNFSASDDIAQLHKSYFLIGKARGVICYAAIVSFNNSNKIHKSIAKGLFPSGITHFIVTAANGQPLNERLVFIDHHDDLHINIEPDQEIYEPKDSIALHLKVTDNAGSPVAGNFSLAVTDDSQIKTDTLISDNILTRMLLTSDIKGYVEQPGFYFQRNSSTALDNLLLTQGWISYESIEPKKLYEAESEYMVKGTVTNIFNKPVRGTKVILLSKSPSLLMETLTDNAGKFVFNNFPTVDTPIFVIKAVNKNGESFNVSINIDEMSAPVFSRSKAPLTMPWYVNSDTTLMNYVKDNIAYKKLQEYTSDGKHQLKEVVIKAKKTIKGSQNLNGSGNADQVIDEKELEQAGKKTFLELLQENVKGFREGILLMHKPFVSKRVAIDRTLYGFITEATPPDHDEPWYFINDKPVKFIIDGTSIYRIFNNGSFSDIRNYLKSHSAEDIKGIEINATSKYSSRYIPISYAMTISPADISFIEITTRSGSGPGIKNTPGLYLYKPLAISWPKKFYKPRYISTDTIKRPLDIRSTIDWEPNIVTDANGKATVSFYAAGRPSTYTIITEGTDFNGNLGFKSQKINISKKRLKAK
jgi:hypothetical protein